MSDLIEQDDQQPITEIPKQSSEELNEIDNKRETKKFPIARLDITRIVSLFRQYGISISVNVVILGAVCFLFLLQRNWIKVGNNDIGRIVEEKMKETIKKNLSLSEDISDITRQRKDNGVKLSKQANDLKSLDLNSEPNVMQVDYSKYVIEGNRLYEQGNYESAAAFYEEGLNKAMPFLNEDFVMYRLGDCYFLSERYEEALKVFQTLNSDYINSPFQFKSRLKIGECYAGMGEFKKARKTLYSIVAQEGKCCSDDDKLTVIDSYFKIADYYMEEARRLNKGATEGTTSPVRSLASK